MTALKAHLKSRHLQENRVTFGAVAVHVDLQRIQNYVCFGTKAIILDTLEVQVAKILFCAAFGPVEALNGSQPRGQLVHVRCRRDAGGNERILWKLIAGPTNRIVAL